MPGKDKTSEDGEIEQEAITRTLSDYIKALALIKKSEIYVKCRTSKDSDFEIINNSTSKEPIRIANNLPAIRSLVNNISSIRRNGLPVKDGSPMNIIKEEFMSTTRNELFL